MFCSLVNQTQHKHSNSTELTNRLLMFQKATEEIRNSRNIGKYIWGREGVKLLSAVKGERRPKILLCVTAKVSALTLFLLLVSTKYICIIDDTKAIFGDPFIQHSEQRGGFVQHKMLLIYIILPLLN